VGLAWQPEQKRMFVGAFLKRHMGFADDPGYVYVLDYSSTPATVTKTFNLQGASGSDVDSVGRRSATGGDPNANCDPQGTGQA